MRKTAWSQKRLERLFHRYNRRFWAEKLKGYSITITKLHGPLGKCDDTKKRILVDSEAHHSDKDIRSTLLHEMAHAAAGLGSLTHGSHFWEQIERLLQKGAPIRVSSSEAGGLNLVPGVVPAKFPLARKALQKARIMEERMMRHIKKQGEFGGEFDIDEDYIIGRFIDAAMSPKIGSPEEASLVIGGELGLINIDGKPVDSWAARALAKGKKVYERQRPLLKHRSVLKGIKS